MLLEKKNRYDQRTDYNPVFSHLYWNTYLQQWPGFIAPKPNPLLRSWHSARSTGITGSFKYLKHLLAHLVQELNDPAMQHNQATYAILAIL